MTIIGGGVVFLGTAEDDDFWRMAESIDIESRIDCIETDSAKVLLAQLADFKICPAVMIISTSLLQGRTKEILSMINKYDHRVTVCEMTPKEAFKALQIDELGNFSLELIDILKKVLNDEGIMAIE